MRTHFPSLACLKRVGLVLFGLAVSADLGAQTLYTATGANGVASTLYTVVVNPGSPSSLTATAVGDIKIGASAIGITGLAVHPNTNVLYGVTTKKSPNNTNSLVTIDPSTGAATLVGALGRGIADISFSATGTLYGWANISQTVPGSAGASELATINLTTGVATIIDPSLTGNYPYVNQGGGMAFSTSGVLYLSPNGVSGSLWTLDPATGNATQGASLDLIVPNNAISGMAWSTASGLLYGATTSQTDSSGPSGLISINPTTGHVVVLGSLPNNSAAVAFSMTFSDWQKFKFTTAEQANSAISGTTAVYGQDGLSNFVKYSLGLEPKTNITTGLPSVTVSGSDWVFVYTRPSRLADVTYSVEVSTDLASWTTTGVTHEFVSNANYVDTYRGRYPLASATSAFFRLNTKLISTTTVTVSNVTYDGVPHGGTAVVTAADLSQSLTVTYTGSGGTTYGPSTTAPTAAGTYLASASYAGDANHGSSSSSQGFTISKKVVTAAADNKLKTYDGAAFTPFTVSYIGLVAPDTSAVVSGSVAYVGTAVSAVNAGSYTITPDVTALSATNYTFTSVNGSLTINKAATTTTVTVSNVSYDGSPHGGTASVAGANLSQSLTVSYQGRSGTTYGPSTTAPTAAGNYTASASYAGDTNHTSSSDSEDYTISQVGSTTTVTTGDFNYDGNPHGQSASVTGANLSQSLTVTYTGILSTSYGPSTTAPTNAGDYSAAASYAGDANHTGSSDSKNYKINQASSTTTVTVSSATFDGAPHGGSAAVSGINLSQSLVVTYTGINATVYSDTTPPTAIGDYSASATFAGDTNHTGSSDSKNFSITP